ncbi:MAG: hypothetical protein RLY78_893 [Pseudomonadota bacterium]|jgi:hypothetical protein
MPDRQTEPHTAPHTDTHRPCEARSGGTAALGPPLVRPTVGRGLRLLAGVLAATAPWTASALLVTNGSFEQIADAPARVTDNLSGWTTASGYTFVSSSTMLGLATGGIFGAGGPVHLIAASISPDGGNFLATDTDYYNFGPLLTRLDGLVPGQSYALSFWQAMGKQDLAGDVQAVAGHWTIGLDDAVLGHSAQVYATADNGYFSGWMLQTLRFEATAPSEMLSFLAVGSGTGLPPFVLLDGVRVAAIPVPDSLALAGLALLLAGVTAAVRRPRPARSPA